MNIWVIVILIIAFALIVGPIRMLRPSPAQRHTEALRLKARALGLSFGMRTLPKLKTDLGSPAVIPVYYLPPKGAIAEMPDWILARTSYEHEGNFHKEWDWQGTGRPNEATEQVLQGYLPRLPETVKVITLGSQGVCVYWTEKGADERFVELLAELLTTLQDSVNIR